MFGHSYRLAMMVDRDHPGTSRQTSKFLSPDECMAGQRQRIRSETRITSSFEIGEKKFRLC